MRKQQGFTLIELIAVIVILAILAVVAVPQYVDLRKQAADAAAAGVGGAIASGSALNYARGVAGASGAVILNSCTSATQLASVISGATSASGTQLTFGGNVYTLGGAAGPIASGATGACTIQANVPSTAAAQSFSIVGCGVAGTC
jgi:MSHA pilin protein MshA